MKIRKLINLKLELIMKRELPQYKNLINIDTFSKAIK